MRGSQKRGSMSLASVEMLFRTGGAVRRVWQNSCFGFIKSGQYTVVLFLPANLSLKLVINNALLDV